MLNVDPNANIIDSGPLFYKLQHALDVGHRWRSFLEAVPSSYCSSDIVDDAEINGQKLYNTPAKYVLQKLGSKGATVNMVIQWLEQIQLESALLFLKNHEPVRIIEQPQPHVEIRRGGTLVLTCKAEAFPSPSYQWFKEEDELLEHQEPRLIIDCVQLEHSGRYVCRVDNFKDGEQSYEFSGISFVEVISLVNSLPEPSPTLTSGARKSNFSCETVTSSKDFSISDSSEQYTKKYVTGNTLKIADILNDDSYYFEIIKQPRSPGKISQGSSIILECKARSSRPFNYQWHSNGRAVTGETRSTLNLLNLYPDPQTCDVRWYYHCIVSNDVESLHSHSVSVLLDSADDEITYFAEDKVALLISNEKYKNSPVLGNCANDVATLSRCLKSIGFKVLSLKDLNHTEMKNIVDLYCQSLCKNSYALFYFSGHGFEQFGQSYFQPVDCSSYCTPSECICAEYVLQSMQEKYPALNVMLLDTCRKQPPIPRKEMHPGKTFKPMMKRNTVYGYATSVFYPSYESDGIPNGYFVKYLKEHITKKLCIHDVLWSVKRDFETDLAMCSRQYPSVESSLSAARCLTDNVISERTTHFTEDVSWTDLSSIPFSDVILPVPELGVSIVVKFSLSDDLNTIEFCNAVDICLYMKIESEESMPLIYQVQLDLKILSDEICSKYFVPNNLNISKSELVLHGVIQVIDLQKLVGPLEGILRMEYQQVVFKTWKLSFGIPAVSKLKLSQRYLEAMSPRNSFSSEMSESEVDLISFDDECSSSDSAENF